MAIFKRKTKKEGREKIEQKPVIEKDFDKKIPVAPNQSIKPTRNIRSFWISEKSTDQGVLNKYIFLVDKKSNKNEIKKEISNQFNVTVLDVNTINRKGKRKNWRNQPGKRPSFKKAIVTLKEGDKIETT